MRRKLKRSSRGFVAVLSSEALENLASFDDFAKIGRNAEAEIKDVFSSYEVWNFCHNNSPFVARFCSKSRFYSGVIVINL